MQLSFDSLWKEPPLPPPDPNDEEFWGHGGKDSFLDRIREEHKKRITRLASFHGWGLDGEFNPIPPIRVFSRAELATRGRFLMAHVLYDLGVFKSVSEARRNGWNKPIVLGEHVVTKRKIRFRIDE